MKNIKYLALLFVAGLGWSETGYRSTIRVTETDNSPACTVGQLKFGSGQVTCSGQSATLNITGGGGGASSLAVTVGVARSSPTSDIMFNPNQMSGSISGSTITIALQSSSVTLQGNTFNGASQLVQLDGSGKLPAIDGSQLTNITGGGGVSVYPATATASFPYSMSASSIVITDATPTLYINKNSGGSPYGAIKFQQLLSGNDEIRYGASGISVYVSTASGATPDRLRIGNTNISNFAPIDFNLNNQGFRLEDSSITFNSGSLDPVLDWKTDGRLRVTGSFALADLTSKTCIGTDANGVIQEGTCTGGSGGGYAVEPATVTFNLAKGFTASTGTITGADGLSVTYGVSVGSLAVSGTGNLSFTNGASPTYQVVGSSTDATVGKCARFSSSWTITAIDCGTAGAADGFFAMQPTTATINISSGLVLSGSAGSAGQYLKSGGAGTVPTWDSPSGTGDAVLASTQTWSGGNTFLGSTTFYAPLAILNMSTMSLTDVLLEVSTISRITSLYFADGSTQTKAANFDGSFGMTFDGGGTALSAPATSYVEIPFSGVITGWTIYADVSGSANISVYKDTYANFPPTSADVISGTETPLLSGTQINQDLTLSSWTTTVTKGDIVAFVLNSASTVTRVTVTVRVTKS